MSALRRHQWWLGRLLTLPLQLLVFAVGIFVLVRVLPGDPVRAALGGAAVDQATYDKAEVALGLDGSYASQLWRYLDRLAHLDLGTSVTGQSVWSEVTHRLPATLELAVLGSVCSALAALAGAQLIVMHPRNPVSRLVRLYARTAGAIPDYIIGAAAIFVFYATLHWLPPPIGTADPSLPIPVRATGATLLDAVLAGNGAVLASTIGHLIMPIGVLTLAGSAVLIKILAAELDNAIDAPATRFRIASGASRRAIYLSVYRRALPPAVALFGVTFGTMLGGVVVIEQLFSLTGMGQYAIDAINAGDLAAEQGFLLVVAFLTLVVLFALDVATMLVDPRRRPGVTPE